MSDEKKSTYNYEAQKKYNEKNVVITLKFIHSEKEFLQSIENACEDLGISRQAFIKAALMEKLESMKETQTRIVWIVCEIDTIIILRGSEAMWFWILHVVEL